MSMVRYWRFEPGQPLRYRKDEDYVQHFEEVFQQAVEACLRVKSRPAVLLSGGLDSSYLTAVAADLSGDLRAIHGFVPGSPKMDERRHAEAVADHLGIRISKFDVSDCWSLSNTQLTDTVFDQPNTPVQAPLMVRLACETAKLGSSVLLDGIGGDEFLSGGPNYICGLLLSGRPARALDEAKAWSESTGIPARRLLVRTAVLPLIPMALRDRARALSRSHVPAGVPSWIDPFALQTVGLGRAMPPRHSPVAWDRRGEYDAFWSCHEREGLPVMGWRERHASLSFGVEARSPFWDVRVIELISRMPGWVHRRAGSPKALMREAMRERLPQQVLERADKGVFDDLMKKGMLEMEQDRVISGLNGPLSRLFYVRSEELRRELELYRWRPHPWWHALWRAITGGIWLATEEGRKNRVESESARIAFLLEGDAAAPLGRSVGSKVLAH
jgi:asparagine synthase (glutamine-hydrolysing)